MPAFKFGSPGIWFAELEEVLGVRLCCQHTVAHNLLLRC